MRGWRLGAVLVLLVAAGSMWWQMRSAGDAASTMALLLSDETDIGHPVVQAWLDAAREEGIPLTPVRASDFLRPTRLFQADYAGVVLPDTVHQIAGGKLLVVHDAATLTLPERAYSRVKSRLSGLVGVDYALYDQLRGRTLQVGEAVPATPAVLARLHLPAGLLDGTGAGEGMSRRLHTGDGLNLSFSLSLGQRRLRNDTHNAARYAYFATRGDYAGQRLMSSRDGHLLAGVRRAGKGAVAFVNLNLGGLKTRADGALLNGFLHWFAADVGDQPVFAVAPAHLKTTLILGQAPYSAHLTARPDFGTAR